MKLGPLTTRLQSPQTIGDFVTLADQRFTEAGLSYGHGTHDSFDEAAFIVLETLGLKPDSNLRRLWKRKVPPAKRDALTALIALRVTTRKPAPYLLNRAYIQGYPFYVDERAIVPRSFIGELLLMPGGFTPPGLPERPRAILDLCTGSGCLAIIAASLYPDAKADAADLSPDALEVAKRNIADYDFDERVTLHQGDLFAPLAGKKYDLIIANPPYVDAEGMDALPPEFRHEPALALGSTAGKDGLTLIRRIIADAPQYLNEDGGLLCEVGRGRGNLEAAFPRLPFLWLDTAASEGEVFWITREDLVKNL